MLCENTEQKLKEKFLRENKENTLKSKKGNIIILLISAAIMLSFSCLLLCDLIFNANIFLDGSKFSDAADFTDKIVLFVMHFVLSLFCVILSAVKKPIKNPVIVLFLIAAVIFAVFYIGLIYGFFAWIYPVVTTVCFVLIFTATRIIDSAKNKRAPKLSQSQISELKTAAEKDTKEKMPKHAPVFRQNGRKTLKSAIPKSTVNSAPLKKNTALTAKTLTFILQH